MRVELHARTGGGNGAPEVYVSDAPLRRIHLSGSEGFEYLVLTVGERRTRSFVIRDPSAIVIEPQPGRAPGMQLRLDSRNRTSMVLRFLEDAEARLEDAEAREDRASTDGPNLATPLYASAW